MAEGGEEKEEGEVKKKMKQNGAKNHLIQVTNAFKRFTNGEFREAISSHCLSLYPVLRNRTLL